MDKEASSIPADGIFPIVITPFDGEDQIDFSAVERLVDDYCRGGIRAIVVPAIASEVEKLSPIERLDLVRTAIGAAAGRVPVIGGVAAESAAEAAYSAEELLKYGCRGLLCRAPEELLQDREKVVEYFRGVGNLCSEGLIIQDLSWSGYGMSLATVLDLFDKIPSFKVLKLEVRRTGYKATQIFRETRHSLAVWSGWAMTQMIEALERGIQGFCPSAFNRPFVQIHRWFQEGEKEMAERIFETVLPYLAWSRQHVDINLHLLKRFCVRKGLFSTADLREPFVEYDAYHENYGNRLIDRMVVWDRMVF